MFALLSSALQINQKEKEAISKQFSNSNLKRNINQLSPKFYLAS